MRVERMALAAALGALLCAGRSVEAAPLTIPNTFGAGTPARASEVNANFTAVKSAVDAKQERVTGTCSAGSWVRAVAADGTVTCDSVTGTSPITVSAGSVGLGSGGITNSHVSAAAAIAASKISGDAGVEFNTTWWNLNPVTTDSTALGSITLSAPGSGVVLLFMNGEAHSTGVNFLHVVGISDGTTSLERTLTPQTNTQTFSVIWATTVSASGNYTYSATARKVDPTACCTAWLSNVNLIALYLPKRY